MRRIRQRPTALGGAFVAAAMVALLIVWAVRIWPPPTRAACPVATRPADPIEQPPAPPPASQPTRPPDPRPEARAIAMEVRAYCPCQLCCGHWADVPMARRTIGGGKVMLYPLIRDGVGFVAAPHWLPRGTWLAIPGYHGGGPVRVLDRGGAVTGRKLEVFIPTHEAARVWGVQRVTVTVYADGPGDTVAAAPVRTRGAADNSTTR